jgi:hypothetical protein
MTYELFSYKVDLKKVVTPSQKVFEDKILMGQLVMLREVYVRLLCCKWEN